MNKIIFFLVFSSLSLLYCNSERKEERLPYFVDGVADPLIPLNGSWRFSLNPQEGFWTTETGGDAWHQIQVPGEPAMQGFAVRHDSPVAYKKTISIPSDYAGKRVFLRFDGVYSYARLWVNGHFVRDHKGGFTRWYSDISELVEPGKKALIALEVTDKKDEISYGSGYAKHPIGGILRSVFLEARPAIRLEYWNVVTDLDENFENALLLIDFKGIFDADGEARVRFRLFDPAGTEVALDNSSAVLSGQASGSQMNFLIKNPKKWTAEDPVLYRLRGELYVDGRRVWGGQKLIGFREVTIRGKQLLINGREVKLRGACRHDIHPTLGRVATRYYDSLDAVLAREANINFIRTSHYPPSEDFVEFCDRLGIYVECESAVCFVDTHRSEGYGKGASQDDPAYLDQYVSQIEEMVSVFRDHPSVIIWSLGNESSYGSNFDAAWKRIKELDQRRPVMFSYPGRAPDDVHPYDILSMHYPDYKGDLEQSNKTTRGFVTSENIPALFDEWAHVACYDTGTLRQDPNIRNFWGKSMDRMWTKCFYSKGGLGGAIWGFVDETFMLPDTCVGYGEWGIIDTWRRKKPEFWNTRKAYSPVRLPLRYITKFKPWEELEIPVANRFDHTNLKELTVTWDVGGQYGTIDSADLNLLPHRWGQMTLPARQWKEGEVIKIEVQHHGRLIDRYAIPLGEPPVTPPVPVRDHAVPALVIEEDGDNFTVLGENFSIAFSGRDGLIRKVSGQGGNLMGQGPYLHFIHRVQPKKWIASGGLLQDAAGPWRVNDIDKTGYGDSALVVVKGTAGALKVNWKIRIDKYGLVDIDYSVAGFGSSRVAELGIKWKLAGRFDTLVWKRRSYWSWYPEPHMGMPSGKTALHPTGDLQRYREHPPTAWALDTRNYYLFGRNGAAQGDGLTNLVKGLKETIYFYKLTDSENARNLSVLSGGREACRVRAAGDGGLELIVDNLWDYVNLDWGNYTRDIQLKDAYNGHVRLYLGGNPVEQ